MKMHVITNLFIADGFPFLHVRIKAPSPRGQGHAIPPHVRYD